MSAAHSEPMLLKADSVRTLHLRGIVKFDPRTQVLDASQ